MKLTEISQRVIMLIPWDPTASSAEVETKINSSSQDFKQETWKSKGCPNVFVGGTDKNLDIKILEKKFKTNWDIMATRPQIESLRFLY